MSTTRITYFDGAYVAGDEALIPPTDVGVIYGLGSFETLRIYAGHAFMADRHQSRLVDTLSRLGIPAPPALELATIFAELSRRNALPDARGRLVVTGGTETADGTLQAPRVFAEVLPLPPDALGARGGVSVIFASQTLRPIAGFKSLSYLPNTLARREARRQGAEEALLRADTGEILEGATSNVHLVIGGRLTTSPADGHILGGVTRGVVLEEARALRIPVDERAVSDADVTGADEAFLTSTIREVLPIADLAGRRFDAPGPVTTRLRDAYRRRVSAAVAAARV